MFFGRSQRAFVSYLVLRRDRTLWNDTGWIMENALIVSLSRQMALQQRMNVIANNMANVGTAGYKSDGIVFEEFLAPEARMNDLGRRDGQISFVHDIFTYNDFGEGNFEPSGNELDVAVSGNGFLVVETPDGERFTRNGQLKLDNNGQLVTLEGHAVLGEGGPITFTAEETNIAIARDGTISSSEGQKDSLRVVTFENTAGLRKQGATLFQSDDTPQNVENPNVIQGMVEKSNVNPVIELTRMIETVRAYTSAAKIMQQQGELRRDAIQKLGSPPQG